MNEAKLLAVEGNKKLYEARETDEEADWIIEAKDGETFKIHPYIFKPKSDFLKSLMSSDFQEKKKKTVR